MNEQENNNNFSTTTPPVQQPTPQPTQQTSAPTLQPAQQTPAPTPQPYPTTSQELPNPQPPKKKNNALIIVIVILCIAAILAFGIAIFFIFTSSDSPADPTTSQDTPLTNRDEPTKKKVIADNPVSGTWNCASGTGSTDDRNNFKTTIELKPDMTFRYGQYGDLSNNHYGGTYTYKDEYKQTADGSYKYYMLSFDTDEYILGGVDTDASKVNLSDMEIGITKTSSGKQAITIFVSTYNMYYCYNDD